MSGSFKVAGFLFSLLLLSGCLGTQQPTLVKERERAVRVKENVIKEVRCVKQSPINITVGKITCKAAACRSTGASEKSGLFALLQFAGVPNFQGIGNGLKDMFMSSLNQVGCFQVLDREALEEIRREIKLAGGKLERMESADYIVRGAITSINYRRKSGAIGGGSIPFLGAISRTKQEAEITMDVRLIGVQNGAIVFSNTYHAKSGKTSYGFGGFGAGGGVGFGGALSGLSGTAMEEVARDVITRATYDIVEKLIPPSNISVTERALEKS